MSEAIQNVKNNKKLLSFLLFLIRNFALKGKIVLSIRSTFWMPILCTIIIAIF